MTEDYSSHADQMAWVKEEAERRQVEVERALREAFADFIEQRYVDVIAFSRMNVFALARAIQTHPLILKPLLAACNIGGRALERDLDTRNVDTYAPKLSADEVSAIAGYLKPFLPPCLELPALVQVDKVEFVDKELRKSKGRWESRVVEALSRVGKRPFGKRQFQCEGETFELDAATPLAGAIEIGVDVKRIEARRDIHKRCDEIVNKASKLKQAMPEARFGAVVYYPFVDEHTNVRDRLRSPDISGVVFASESDDSIASAVTFLLQGLGVIE